MAKLMNRHFVSILVDREDRPDLDHIYMEAIRMFDQSAGCPLMSFAYLMDALFGGVLTSLRKTKAMVLYLATSTYSHS